MIKRTIEVSSAPAHLAVRNRQLLLRRDGQVVASIPCEDLGVVVVDHPQASYTHAALCELLQAQAVLVVCGPDHLPQGLLLPLADHSQVVWRLREQLTASRPLKKRLWKQIVRAKIRAQAANLDPRSAPYRRLQALFREVRSGDSTNREAQAARVYWNAWLVNPDHEPPEAEQIFRRDPDGLPPNALLNYGYAILRAAVARAIVAAGLLPALGLQHTQRGNPFCLADDLLEPLRPLVDARVRALYWAGQTAVDRDTKAALLELLTLPVRTADERGPLMVALHRYVASLVKCYQRVQNRLEIPVRCSSVDTAACGS
jgi:CRISPR-associated protein Cas1